MIGEHTLPQTPPGRNRNGGLKDWSRPSGPKSPVPAPFDSYDSAGLARRATPPAAFVRRLSQFLGAEMAPAPEKPDRPWRWDIHPGAGVLTLPWPRHWAFRRAHAGDDSLSLKDHVVVGSWKVPLNALNWWIAAAEMTAARGLDRERALCRGQGDDPASVPRGFKVMLLPPGQNWMEPQGPDVHLMLAGSPTEFPALDPDAAAAYARSAARSATR